MLIAIDSMIPKKEHAKYWVQGHVTSGSIPFFNLVGRYGGTLHAHLAISLQSMVEIIEISEAECVQFSNKRINLTLVLFIL